MPEYVTAAQHAPMIAAFVYRNVMVCRSCVLPEEFTMTGQFFDWKGVAGSGWTCERCGIELERQPVDGGHSENCRAWNVRANWPCTCGHDRS